MRGHMELLMTFAGAQTIPVNFLIVEQESPYNVILRRPSLNKLAAIISTPHLTMKFPLLNGQVGTIHAYQKEQASVMLIA